MKNFLNIFLVALLTVLIFNLFLGNKTQEWLNITFESQNYTVPASVWVKISNFSDEKFSLNACENIEIRKNWKKIEFSQEFCEKNKSIEAETKKVTIIDYKSEYEKFKETWDYNLKVVSWESEFADKTTVSMKWAFSKVFSELVYAPIYNLFIFLIDTFQNSFGWAILIVTIIIRLLLIWPQHKSIVAQKKIQELQPKIQEIQEKYKDQQERGMKLFELYKKEKVNPMWSCGFMFIQLPIILVLYNVILYIWDPSNSFYLYEFLKDFNFETINYNFYGLELLAVWGIQGLVLAVIVAFLQFLQVKYSISKNPLPKKEGVVLEKKAWENNYSQMMPDPEMMNKFMLYVLPLIVWITTYMLFAGVWLYWWISTLFMLVQQIIVNNMFKK